MALPYWCNRSRRYSNRAVLAVVVVVVVFAFMWSRLNPKPVSVSKPERKYEPGSKLVLVWTKFFRDTNWVRPEHFEWCPHKCDVTEDKSKVLESDAVLFHERDIESLASLPSVRRQDQRWVWLTQETYMNFERDLSQFNSLFNWTMTYRRVSDVVIPYGAVRKRKQMVDKELFDKTAAQDARGRTKFVAIRISNCDTTKTDRMNYVRKLKDFIPVDVLGACGESCDKRDSCNDDYMKQYKFYLAFENSHCTDYITEKFWLPLEFWHNVPIVMGGSSPEDYKAIAPPHSYIHVDSFKSIGDLGKYLDLLNKNDTLYEEYFNWRRSYEYDFPGYCNLCAALHNERLPPKTYHDLVGWYKNDRCSSEHPIYA